MDRSVLSPSDSVFVQAFESCAIPLSEWSHRSHIRMAWIYLRLLPPAEAIAEVRTGLQRFVAAHAVPDSLERGYHETITVAWMRLVESAMTHHCQCDSSDAFCDAMPHLLCQTLLRVFYSRDRIRTPAAKAGFIPPDLAELPAG